MPPGTYAFVPCHQTAHKLQLVLYKTSCRDHSHDLLPVQLEPMWKMLATAEASAKRRTASPNWLATAKGLEATDC